MIEFKPLGSDVQKIKEYFSRSKISFCDISAGVKYMWREDFKIDFAEYNGTLIMKESCRDYKNAFYFPIGNDEEGALKQIEEYCKITGQPFLFCYIDESKKRFLENRYPLTSSYYLREWSDYIYPVENFLSYSGKSLSGKRNHVNKFKKLYPDYRVKILEKEDLTEVKDFLKEFEEKSNLTVWSAISEESAVSELAEKSFDLNCFGLTVRVDGKIISLAIGEKNNDTLIVHVEKGLTEYDGVYPLTAQEFVKRFATQEIKYVNREEDCGDEGLRKAKLQYHPSEIKPKYVVEVFSPFDEVSSLGSVTTSRLILSPFDDKDGEALRRLFTDEKINELWGYDFKEDLNGESPDVKYFLGFIEKLKRRKEEIYYAVRLNGKVIGDVVLHDFSFYGGLQIGVRFFEEYQGCGYAYESLSEIIKRLFNGHSVKTINMNCYKANAKSKKLIERLNFEFLREDVKKYYYSKVKGEKMELAKVFCDNAVLQAGKPVRVFGNGDGEGVIEFNGKSYPVKSKDGYFEAVLDVETYGGPYELKATLNGVVTTIKNIMVGEVILCAGQSNMQWRLEDGKDCKEAPKGKANSMLRAYVTKRLEANDSFDSDSGWVVCEEDNVSQWTALGYYIAEMINAKFGCAVGVLCCFQGASNIHTWISRARTLKDDLRMDGEKALYKEMENLYFDWNTPGTCYEYQFKPIAPYTVSRVYWYQGCSSTNAAASTYDKLLKALVEEWRKDLKDNVPFVIYQLHDFPIPDLGYIKDEWKVVQKAQEDAPKYIDNCICIKTADISEHETIHPVNKYPLAIRTMETVYGK